MADWIQTGTWVELSAVVLRPGERAPQVPDETQQVPLEMKVKGALTHNAEIGGDAEVVTAAGRTHRGRLEQVNPPYTHGFGRPVPELLAVADELRALLHEGKKR